MATQAITSEGITLSYDSGTETFKDVGEVTDLSGPGGQATVIQASHLGSSYVEKLMGLADEGQVTASVNLIPGDDGQKAMRGFRTSKARTPFKITLTDDESTELTFDAFVLGFTTSMTVDDRVTAEITLEVTGKVTWSTDA